MNLVLTGFMGTGKTETGKLLAQRLKRPFYDTDQMIEKEAGLSIAEIFVGKGEVYFRDTESQAIRLLSPLKDTVIATGGGAVLRTENVTELKKNGRVFCLMAKPETIWRRINNKPYARPLLDTKDPIGSIHTLLVQREPYYRQCDFFIPTDGKMVEEVVEAILKLFCYGP